MDPYLISILVFVGIIIVLVIKDRKNIEFGTLTFIRRTQRGRDLIGRISDKNKPFWNKVGIVSVIVGIIGIVASFASIIFAIYQQLFVDLPAAAGPAFILPAPSAEAEFMPGVIGVPFWSWIIAIASLMIVHEGMHGIMLKTINSKIKSLGALIFIIIPGAFVEPDEVDLEKKSWLDQLKVYSAGSFANFCLAGIILLLINFIIGPVFMTQAVGFMGYTDFNETNGITSPAQEVNLTTPMLSIDNQRLRSLEDINRSLENKRPGDTIQIETMADTYNLTLEADPDNPEEPIMGISGLSVDNVPKEQYRDNVVGGMVNGLNNILFWMFLINLGVGLFNLMPLKPLDGGLMVEAIAGKYAKKNQKKIVWFITGLSLTLIIITFAFVFI